MVKELNRPGKKAGRWLLTISILHGAKAGRPTARASRNSVARLTKHFPRASSHSRN